MTATANEPLVSVIIPTRNRAQLLRRSIASVLAQTYCNLEVIVVNDASTDQTREVLATIDDPRLLVIHGEINKGAAAARNAGIRIAKGEWLSFQDDDDYWLVQKLEKQVQSLMSAPSGVGWCLAGYFCVEPQRCFYVGGDRYVTGINYRNGNVFGKPDYRLIATPGWLVRRDLLERAGLFDERLRSYDDWELGLRLDQITKRIHVDEPLFIQDQTLGGGLMKLERARAADMRIIMEKHGHLWACNRQVLARHWYFIGRAESLHDPHPAGRDALMQSLRQRPARIRTWGALALAYMNHDFMRRITAAIRRWREARLPGS